MLFLMFWYTKDAEFCFQLVCLEAEVHMTPAHLIGNKENS